MTMFWLAAALLVAVCMAVLLRPLMRRSLPTRDADVVTATDVYRAQLQELDADLRRGTLDARERGQAQDELGRRLLDDELPQTRGAAAPKGEGTTRSIFLPALLLAVVPSAAILLYLQLGNPVASFQSSDVAATANADAGHAISNAQVEGLVNQLAQRLRREPDDAQGWYMLGRSYAALERPSDAALAYAKAVELVPDDAMLRADYADVLGSVNGGSLRGPAQAQIDKALAIDPEQPKAIALAATAALERGDKAHAIAHWEHLLRLLPPQSQTASRVAASLAQARGETAAVSAAGRSVSGRVQVSDGLPRRPGGDETVFVYARPADGSRMPLAVLRRQVRDLPFDFTLDDSVAMSPDRRISMFPQVVIEARISASGNPIAQAGDLLGGAGPVAVGSGNIVLTIDGAVGAGAGSSR